MTLKLLFKTLQNVSFAVGFGLWSMTRANYDTMVGNFFSTSSVARAPRNLVFRQVIMVVRQVVDFDLYVISEYHETLYSRT